MCALLYALIRNLSVFPDGVPELQEPSPLPRRVQAALAPSHHIMSDVNRDSRELYRNVDQYDIKCHQPSNCKIKQFLALINSNQKWNISIAAYRNIY